MGEALAWTLALLLCSVLVGLGVVAALVLWNGRGLFCRVATGVYLLCSVVLFALLVSLLAG